MEMIERKACGLLEVKFASGDGVAAKRFSGHGAVFNNVDSYGDVIMPGAFSSWLADVKSGKQPWPSMLSQHGGWGVTADDMTPVGVWAELSEDGEGLKVDGQLADTQRANDLHTLMKMKPRPAIDGMSIGYIPKEWEARTKPDDPRRKLKRIDVMEISLVTFPANRKARVADVKASNLTERELERWLMQDAGLSRSEARIVMNQGFKALIATQDAGEEVKQDEMNQLAESIRRRTGALRAAA